MQPGGRLADPELWRLALRRREELRDLLLWALTEERAAEEGEPWRSLWLADRPDVEAAGRSAAAFPEMWWGLVVFTAFGSAIGADAVRSAFAHPIEAAEAESKIAGCVFPSGSVGHHRRRRGLEASKRALLSACRQWPLFRDVLECPGDFDSRYRVLRSARVPEWGRTTCFDLFVRAGRLGLGGMQYEPARVYLADSTGPAKGFERVWGVCIGRANAEWGERVVAGWCTNWFELTRIAGVEWAWEAGYSPGDLENALCVWSHDVCRCGPTGSGTSYLRIC